ncbi:MAG: DUF1294 domain-containing protein [Negativicutes bacterium]|nr:DUF1294 domain-containing protein [Negativicutes bacterium]
MILVIVDKHRAKSGKWRISEQTFFLIALAFGAAGILIGMYAFRHKTRHLYFVVGIPMVLIINLALVYFIR